MGNGIVGKVSEVNVHGGFAGRVRDYGESPVKRARLALEGFTWGRPVIPSTADLAGLNEVMVAAESVMSQQAADLAPGTLVEYRSREAYLIGGWFRAKILQVGVALAAVLCCCCFSWQYMI